MSGLHTEILDERQLACLPTLGKWASTEGFYLGGGTAVALYFGHRRSVDFDWFTSSAIEDPMVLAGGAREAGLQLQNVQTARGTLHGSINGVRVSFFQYRYPQITVPTEWSDYGVRLASLDDLACMKLVTIGQRGSRKDFVDVYILAMRHKPLSEMIALYRRKYSTDDIARVLIGLTYFEDAEDEPMPPMLTELSWDEVKRRFREWAKQLASQ